MTGSDRYQRLRDAIAAGPMPGPWAAYCDHPTCQDITYIRHAGAERWDREVAMNYRDRTPETVATMDLVAAADPDTIAALLGERDALREACAAMVEWDDRENDHAVDFSARQDLCRAAFDKARSALAMGDDDASL